MAADERRYTLIIKTGSFSYLRASCSAEIPRRRALRYSEDPDSSQMRLTAHLITP
jgi:hypothetical protein